jgi:hypothetical protein
MAVITASGGEVYDVQTPFPCLVTFMVRPKPEAIPRPRTAPAPTQTMNGCTLQELARRYAAPKNRRGGIDLVWSVRLSETQSEYKNNALLRHLSRLG